jgi:ELWxxDGT repeat protein
MKTISLVAGLTLWLSFPGPAKAQPGALQAADINGAVTNSAFTPRFSLQDGLSPVEGVAMGPGALLTFDDGIHGTELWRTDGGTAGTAMVVDLCPGSCGSFPASFAVMGTHVYFHADDGVHGRELWRSDGTAAGTELVADTIPGLEGSRPGEILAVGGEVWFNADTPGFGRELWRSDGTSAGTWLLLDVAPGALGSRASPLAVRPDGKVFFAAFHPDYGRELWITDGTPAGTQVLDATAPGPASGGEYLHSRWGSWHLLGATLIYRDGQRYWRSDGSESGTAPLPQGAAWLLGAGAGKVFFRGESINELWTSDGTPTGTQLQASLPSSHAIGGFTAVGHAAGIHFWAYDGTGSSLWESDGTQAGTQHLLDLPSDVSWVEGSIPHGSLLLFFATDGITAAEPWITDGTVAGTAKLAAATPGLLGSYSWGAHAEVSLHAPLEVGGSILMRLLGEGFDVELWRVDASSASQIAEINEQTSSMLFNLPDGSNFWPRPLLAVGTSLHLQATDGTHGLEPWLVPGSGPPILLADLEPGPDSSVPTHWTQLGPDTLFVTGGNGSAYGVWRTAGAADPPLRLGPGDWASDLTRSGSLAFFYGGAGATTGLWRTDGSVAGTLHISSEIGFPLVPIPGGVAFAAFSGLWRSDGTTAGTTPVPGSPTIEDSLLIAAAGDRVFFAGTDIFAGQELWLHDGNHPPAQVLDVSPGPSGSLVTEVIDFDRRRADKIVALGAGAVFLADDGTTGEEPWASDGTGANTFRVGDVFPGASSSDPDQLMSTGTRAFFVADDSIHGRELWSTDGTVEGTRLVLDILPGPGSSVPRHLAAVGDHHIVFTAWEPLHGAEAWVSDGTPEGTFRVTDIAPGPLSASPVHFTAGSERLFFAANDNTTGFEPWSLPLTALASPATYFYTLTPCRLFDSRLSTPLGEAPRTFPAAGNCGIPASARAIAANVTVVGGTAPGHVRLGGAFAPHTAADVAPFAAGQARAQQSVLRLGYGELTATAALDGAGSVHVVVDVTGWFE